MDQGKGYRAMKKIFALILALIITASLGLAVFAGDLEGSSVAAEDKADFSLESVIMRTDLDNTQEQFLAGITRPNKDETVYKKYYPICGTSTRDDVIVILTRYNPETEVYEEYANTDGDSRWGIGSSGLFSMDVELKEGANKFKIIVYDKDEEDNLVLGESLQVDYFTITYYASLKDAILKPLINFTESLFNDILKK